MIRLLKSPGFMKKIKVLFLFLGLLFFAYLVYKLGPAEILSHLKKVGFKSFYIVELSFFITVLGVWAWQLILKGGASHVSYWKLMEIKLIGEMVNTLTPLGWGTGDPVRILLLKKKFSVTQSAASVVVDRTLQSLAMALFMIAGVFLFFKTFNFPLPLKVGLLVSLSVILGGCIFLYIRSHQGLLNFFVGLLKKLRIKKFTPQTLQHITEIDTYISEFYKNKKGHFLLSLSLQFCCRILGVVEIYLIAYLVGNPLTMLQCYLLASMTLVINMVFVFVPGSIGVLEGAFAAVFALFHLNPAIGSSIQIIRRMRMLFWNFVGLILAAGFEKKNLGQKEIFSHSS